MADNDTGYIGLPAGSGVAEAVARLEEWRGRTRGTVTIILDSAPDSVYVHLHGFGGDDLGEANAPTLRAAKGE